MFRKKNQISSFALEEIMKANPGSTLTHVHKSEQNYWVESENHFLVLPDGKTIIGADGSKNKHLFTEDISASGNNAYRQIATHGKTISTVLYKSLSKTLFVGDNGGRVVEYQEDANKETWTKIKDYDDLGIGRIYSVDQIGDVVVFGGNNYTIRAIDSVNKKLLPGILKTAIKYVCSLQFFELPEEKIYLSICGRNPNYLNNGTDIYDATELGKKFNVEFQMGKTVDYSGSSTSSEEINGETQNFCNCDSKKMMELFVSKMGEYLDIYRSIINSDFEKKLKILLSNYDYSNY
jgi:hypothetical protein